MTREEKIKAIYEEIAERINFNGLDWQSLVTWDLAPVMIGDVLDWWDTIFNIWNEKYEKILKLWEEKRKPIEDQSYDCIDYIYNLINQN